MVEEGRVFVIGNPLLDISANVSSDYLKKYDLKPANAILAEEKHIPMYKEIIDNYEVEYSAGGAGQNTARAISWMLGKKNIPTYVGCIGNDHYGKTLSEAAKSDGVDVRYLIDEDTPTGTCAALIIAHERSLVANLGAANMYKKPHFDSSDIQERLNKAKILYASGFFLTVCPEALIDIGKHACEHNKTFMFNLAAPFLVDFFTDKLKSVLPYTDIVIGNETEGATFGKKFYDTDDLKQVALKLGQEEKVNSKKERIVIITQGPGPVIVYRNNKVTEYPTVPLSEDVIVDSNGAGDSFAGAFIAGLLLEKDFDKCIFAGDYCAAEILKTSGVVYKGTPSFEF